MSLLLLTAIVVGSVLAGGGAGWLLKPAQKVKPLSAEAVQAAAAPGKVVAPSGGLTASGYVVARTRATVAAEVTGRVVEVRVEEGQAVRAGQVLAILDGSLAAVDAASTQARALSAEAALNSAKVQYVQAQRDLARRASGLAWDGHWRRRGPRPATGSRTAPGPRRSFASGQAPE